MAHMRFALILILATQALGCAKFESNGDSRATLLSASVLAQRQGEGPEPVDPPVKPPQPEPPKTPQPPTPPPSQPPQPPKPVEPKLNLPVKSVCSLKGTERYGTNVKKSTRLTVRLHDSKGNVACSHTEGVRADIMNMKKIVLECPGLANGTYKISLINPDSSKKWNLLEDTQGSFTSGDGKGTDIQIVKTAKELKVADKDAKKKIWVLYGDKHQGCDANASPLIIDTHSNNERPEPVSLTAPLDGIWFDILGANAAPVAHSKYQISWINNADRYKFLVLPSNGRVNGIDQMFGDNTLGPDGKFARDGFAALAKYDGTDFRGVRRLRPADGKIDIHDDVYSKLALWSDLNHNGIAEAGELQSLRDAGLIEIDLNYDPNFREEDIYGNSTELKSIVKFEDGRQRLIFDLWFRYL